MNSNSVDKIEMLPPKGFGYKRDAVDSILKAVTTEREALGAEDRCTRGRSRRFAP